MFFNKPKLVKFKDGTYGIRRFSIWDLSYEFKDLDVTLENGMYIKNDFWWTLNSTFIQSCKAEKHIAEKMFNIAYSGDVGVVVKCEKTI